MIVSASRRTDIPAFYAPWFFNRLQAGYVLVPNPYDSGTLSRISLMREAVDCLVFWTKNPEPMLGRLDALRDYPYFFHFTLNAYERDIERAMPPLETRIATFRRLSRQIGPERVVWRYDPVLLNDRYDEAFHAEAFARIARRLEGAAASCMLGFIDHYPAIRRTMDALGIGPLTAERVGRLAAAFAQTARACGMRVQTCTDKIDLRLWGIPAGRCIDPERIDRLTGYPVRTRRDRNQRPACQCIESIDIGTYASCLHGCAYCYAMRHGHDRAAANRLQHDPASPLLIGQVRPGTKIRERPIRSLRHDSAKLF